MGGDERGSAGLAILSGLVQLLGTLIVRLLFGSCRVTVVNGAAGREWVRRKPVIAALWHHTMIMAGHHFRRERVAVLASRSKDGELASALLRGLGLRPVRGSSSRGGREGLAEMIEAAREGYTAAFVADGPRGPARVAKIGAILAAAQTGLPVLPVAIHMRDAWRLRTWDRTAIPKPFSRVFVEIGRPLAVPAQGTREELEALRQRVEAELNAMEEGLGRRA